MMRWLDSTTASVDLNLNKIMGDSEAQKSLAVLLSMGLQSQTQLSN